MVQQKQRAMSTINWKNINLKDDYQRSRNLLEPLDFETILLEISCNFREIDEKTVREHIVQRLNEKYNEALDIMQHNLTNITEQAKTERNEP